MADRAEGQHDRINTIFNYFTAGSGTHHGQFGVQNEKQAVTPEDVYPEQADAVDFNHKLVEGQVVASETEVCEHHVTTGTSNYQRSALTRHMNSDDHVLAKKTVTQQRFMAAAKVTVQKQYMPMLESQLRTAAWMAEQNIANNKFLPLIDLQIANGSSHFTDRKGIYTNHQAPATMQEYMAKVLKEMAIVRIKDSPFLGIMVDESLDIATNKKLIMFCKIIHNGKIQIEFAANISIHDGKADTVYNCIVEWLQEIGYNINKVSGFGSDGASVMTGRLTGVGVRLKALNPKIVHIWCAAHRLALVSYWASKRIPYLHSINEILIAIYNFYNYSAPRYVKIKELQALLGKKVKRFKRPSQIRWLSMSDAVDACYESYSALVLGLEHEVASSPNSEGGNKAKGILKKIKTFKFIAALCLLKDILKNLDQVSKTFQKNVLDIHQLKTVIKATRNLINSYRDNDPPTLSTCIQMIDENEEFQGIPLVCKTAWCCIV
ncbi:uncharacterized protein C17orf113-like [Saccoglossus kowalevskii]|uniref:Uncharacterized protein KIAA1586-like n=1 Tax=Saccoglossus kowalevskii TaxID=10224 RepID=A0ABM0M1F3_SACKO|nr:PREDICTED: uncharacterized protein KIAA1586-like [Saccoglossus kowalevskii]